MALSNDKQVDLLVALLDCYPNDLTALEGCRIPMLDIVERAVETAAEAGTEVDINTLTWAMFDIAKGAVQDYINTTVDSYRHTLGEQEHHSTTREWLERAVLVGEHLDIFQDTDSSHIGSEVEIHFVSNADKYKNYFENALDHFEILTGYSIEDIG
ncbi:hypothetical protein BSP36_223 [Bacillus phage BSP36]|nr:hypothetical protein BSP36_223 [Bacillus phage BSP36]